MPEGTIKKLVRDKGFGFIDAGTGTDYFFHRTSVEGVEFDELSEGQRVTYELGESPKGPRAENIRVI